ncbi:S-methyl-5-thioribose-1-phosphate isomerase [Candidatus Woesearchaeota archaeon]|nr:S-methyl-5-thioribose-1-phosphate isomerase [Candidatus Woesearchaeota archaeon]
MKVKDKNYRTIWMEGSNVLMVDQNKLPFEFSIYLSKDYIDTIKAIKSMTVRGAGAIGAAAGYAMAQAFIDGKDLSEEEFFYHVIYAGECIKKSRPTAQNLFYAVDRVLNVNGSTVEEVVNNAVLEAQKIADEDAEQSREIGRYGSVLIKENAKILTHCNAGWLAFVDYGTALSPIYIAKEQGKNPFVYVDETRPRSQGARLTAWELCNEDIDHRIISDNAAAYYMSKGLVDLVIVGADRIALNGDVANKIGTLEKAILAKHYGIPFYVAAPLSTFDANCKSGNDIPIEERSEEEVLYQTGLDSEGKLRKVLVASPCSKALNPAFDITPSEIVTAIITNKGIIEPRENLILELFIS